MLCRYLHVVLFFLTFCADELAFTKNAQTICDFNDCMKYTSWTEANNLQQQWTVRFLLLKWSHNPFLHGSSSLSSFTCRRHNRRWSPRLSWVSRCRPHTRWRQSYPGCWWTCRAGRSCARGGRCRGRRLQGRVKQEGRVHLGYNDETNFSPNLLTVTISTIL